jgi:dienelactone hydrolase
MTTPSTPLQRRVLAVLLGLSAVWPGAAGAQRLSVEPAADVMVGTPLTIAVSGLRPGQPVTLRSLRRARGWSGEAVTYRAEARFQADAQGRVDLAAAAPLAGSYEGADVQGLFWSAAPVPSAADDGVAQGLAEGAWRLSVLDGGRDIDAVTLTLRNEHPAVLTTPAPDFPGAVLAALPGAALRPALIVLGGSEGGSATGRRLAGLLAAQGYAVLALPYYSPTRWGPAGPMAPELPQLPVAFADIPVDRLQAARDWLRRQPGVDGERIGLVGVSKGAEFALLAASRMPWVRSVVAVVPSDVTWEGWGPGTTAGQVASFSWQGRPLPFVPYQGMAEEMQGFSTGAPVRLRRPQDAGRAAHAQAVAAARIPVEQYAGPLLVIGGDDDQVWDSGGMARAIEASRRAAGRETEALVFPQAGHALSGPGWSPTTVLNAGPMQLGGSPAANGRALAEAWPRSLAFLQRTLGPVPAVPGWAAGPAR